MASIFLQSILPQHIVSGLAGALANSRLPVLKNFFIKRFVKHYNIDLSECQIKNPLEYACFNDFFIRQLDMRFRPIEPAENAIISPVDGVTAQIGRINKNLLLQAKDYYYNLETLLGGDLTLAKTFQDGHFATLYLSPRDYHRVHMPLTGQLIKTVFVPGKLFSVNKMACELIPGLFSRNERLICLFETAAGPMAVILVGALIVGSIQAAWMPAPIKHSVIHTQHYSFPIKLNKGDELGHFKLGSTVILLFGRDKIDWLTKVHTDQAIRLGQLIGTCQQEIS